MNRMEPITGRYLHVELGDSTYRVAFEEAGQGIALVCLHTAGGDLRQYRHLLNDREVTERFRVIAFDMPWHGRSLPPDGAWDRRYVLTRQFYLDFVQAFCAALELDRPALLGCSMGGYLMLDIAVRQPGLYRALIGVQPRAFAPFWTHLDAVLDHPEVNYHGFTEVVRSVSAPCAPADRRREVEWIYSQAGPGVLAGDFHYAAEDHDVRDTLRDVDPRAAGLYVIGGDWDPSCLPEHTDELAALAPGLPVTRIPDAGHFPPSENPESFRTALLPILAEVAAASVPAPEKAQPEKAQPEKAQPEKASR
jgi:pimeloyl-ACP methyl ester carboxylesterase